MSKPWAIEKLEDLIGFAVDENLAWDCADRFADELSVLRADAAAYQQVHLAYERSRDKVEFAGTVEEILRLREAIEAAKGDRAGTHTP